MLTEYIAKQMARARYKVLDDGTYWGEIPGIQGVWGNAKQLERCRAELQSVLEDWLLLQLKEGGFVIGLEQKKQKQKVYA